MTEAWTPYGLERIRQRLLWRRRIIAAVVAVLLLATVAVVIAAQPSRVVETEISLAGRDSSQIEIEIREPLKTKPLRVELSPGGVTLVGGDEAVSADRLTGGFANYPAITGARPINFLAYLLGWGPIAFLGYLVWAAGRGEENPVAQVNFGIYKGAMPLEMVTESYRHLVRTQRNVQEPIFGKDRSDYVPDAGRPAVEFEPLPPRP